MSNVRCCDICGKTIKDGSYIQFSRTVGTQRDEGLETLDICKGCYRTINSVRQGMETRPNYSAKKTDCKYAERNVRFNSISGNDYEVVTCLGTPEKDECPGYDNCDSYKEKCE